MQNDFTITSSEPAWKDLLKTTTISSIVPKRPLITTQYHEHVSTLLQRMSDAKVLSAVIIDHDPKIGVVGFVDVLDLLRFVIDITQSSQDISHETIENLKWEGRCFEREKSGCLVNISRADPLVTISNTASLWDVVCIFATEVHRLAVIEPGTTEHLVSNIISQTDIVNFIATRGVWIGSNLEKTLKEVGLHKPGVATQLDHVNVISVLRYMQEYQVSGVAIVDKFGRLIANFSASDLIGLTATNFLLLSLSVKEFLQRIHGFTKPPVYCKSSDTVESLIMKMTLHKVHRVYLIDEHMVPRAVITMTDVMQLLLA